MLNVRAAGNGCPLTAFPVVAKLEAFVILPWSMTDVAKGAEVSTAFGTLPRWTPVAADGAKE